MTHIQLSRHLPSTRWSVLRPRMCAEILCSSDARFFQRDGAVLEC